MQYFTLFVLFSLHLASQDSIRVYVADNDTKMGQIEEEIIKNIFLFYNRAHKQQKHMKIKRLSTFKDLINIIKDEPIKNKDSFLAISQITITKERQSKYDFSISYAPVKESIITLKSNRSHKLSENSKVGYLKETIQENSITNLKKRYKFAPVKFEKNKDMHNALINKDVDFILAENVDVWDSANFKIYKILENQHGTGYGVLYLKNSKLKKLMDEYLNYYMNSVKFKRLIMYHYGKDVLEYFTAALKLKSLLPDNKRKPW